MNSKTVDFVRALVEKFSILIPVFKEHIEDQNGEVLPHVFLADITRLIINRIQKFGLEDKITRKIIDELETAYMEGNNQIIELISASFLENLPMTGESGAEIRLIVGPHMQEHLRRTGNIW